MLYKNFCSAVVVLMAAGFIASCSVTTAPTDASSATTGQSTDASSDLTSSTTLGDDDEKAEEAVEEFVTANFSRLRADMSVGQGEYLTSLASLLAIEPGHRDSFYALTKNNFTDLFVSSQTTAAELVSHLKQEIAQAKI
ncbi:hypothetical protein A9Q89_00080 [Gammaproteobacteria bacterium 53_120_T64]|nr:hypothetical protein A9Q89_00080 [Gammaproteobacteria bacterium 53_120_T64]